MCAHHLVPFYGHAHIAYIPRDRILGLSKFARILEFYAKRPQLQERLTEQVVTYLEEQLKPLGIRINAVCPGVVRTPLVGKSVRVQNMSEATGCTPLRTSTVSVEASRMPSSTSALSTTPFLMRITNGLSPRSSTAASGTTGAVRTSLATCPSANNPPTSTPFAFGSDTMMRTCRVAGSATGLMFVMRPVNCRPG